MQPYRPRQFVWCRYPRSVLPGLSDPKVRIGYVVAVLDAAPAAAVVLYTAAAPWPADAPRPTGLIAIDEKLAPRLGPRPFIIDARELAVLPITPAFFPYLHRPDHGVQGTAPLGLDRDIRTVLAGLHRAQIAIKVRGPGRRRR